MLPHPGLLLAESRIVHLPQHHVQQRFVVSAIVGETGGHVVSVFELGDQVLAPQFNGVGAQFNGQQVDQTLYQERRFRPSCAAVSINRGGVVEHTVDVSFGRTDVVRAAVDQTVKNGGDTRGSGRQIGTHASVNHSADSGDLALAGGRHLHMLDVVAAVNRRLEALRPGGGPLDGTAQLHGAE